MATVRPVMGQRWPLRRTVPVVVIAWPQMGHEWALSGHRWASAYHPDLVVTFMVMGCPWMGTLGPQLGRA